MYFRIKPIYIDETITIDRVSHWDFSLTLGEKLPDDMPIPIEYEIDTDIGGSYFPTSFLPDPVFRVEFVEALMSAGVDNFDSYEVNITNPETDDQILGYVALNIIGKVACTDMDASETEHFIEEQHIIRKLILDESKTYGVKMFRLAEWTQIILVHENVVNKLSPYWCKDLEFEPVRKK